MEVGEIQELVLTIVKLAGHTAYESAAKCCKNWRTWIKRDTVNNFEDWKEIFGNVMVWNDEHSCETLPGGILHGCVFKVNYECNWASWTSYHRGLKHGKTVVKNIIGFTKKETIWLWNKGDILSSRSYERHVLEGMGGLRYAN